MESPGGNAAEIRKRGWRQGAFASPKKLLKEPGCLGDDGSLLYVLSHDCDLVQPDFEKEPYVELLRVEPIERVDGNNSYGKNSRVIDFTTGDGSYRAKSHQRFIVPRATLCDVSPEVNRSVDDSTRGLISEWISKRYIRPAFPDEFNKRLSSQQKEIRSFLAKHGSGIWKILIHCNPPRDELDAGEEYELRVWLVGRPDVEVISDESEKIAREFAAIVKRCRAILLEECRPVLTDHVTLSHTQLFSEWDFAYLTHRETDQAHAV